MKILSNRQLAILPPRLSEIVPAMSELSAANVGLVAVNKNAFEGLSHLKVLNVSRNEISVIESECFESLMELEVLDLSFNMIASIENNIFSQLNNLEVLNLEHNLLTKLPELENLLNLKILNLSHNKIQELKEELFTVINVIEEFYINSNQLHKINPKIVSNFETAKIIDFADNFCTNQRFPENLTMVQLAIEIMEKCWNKF